MNPIALLAFIGGPLFLLWLISGIPTQNKQLNSVEHQFRRELRRREMQRLMEEYHGHKPRRFQ